MKGVKALKPNRIPALWEDVTPQWMTAAIANHHPDAIVADTTILTIDDGTNRRARFGIHYAAGSGPEAVFLKAHSPNHRFVHLRNGNLFNEARLFGCGVTIPVDHPMVFKSIVDYLRLDFLLVMEDLTRRGAEPRDATRPLNADQVENGLRGLARLHSQYWGISKKTHPQLRWLKTWTPTTGWQIGLRRRIPTGLDRGATQLPCEVTALSGDEIVKLWSRYVNTLSRGPMTLLHGDAHIGNTYVIGNTEVGFLDWQVVRRGNWSQDVGYFLIGAMTEQDRRDNEVELIEIYRNALDVPENQKPSAKQAWLRYRTTPAYGLAIWLSTLGTDGYQSAEISRLLAQRFASAFVDLDCLSALDSIGA
jgi:hypothetical protein